MLKGDISSSEFFVNGHSEGDCEVIFKKYFLPLVKYAQLFVQVQPAEDIVQDVLVYLWENKKSIQIHTSLDAYLFRSVYQRCLSYLKRQNLLTKHHSQLEIELRQEEMRFFDTDQNEAIRSLFMNDLKKDLDTAIEALPERCRQVFELSFMRDLRNKEISEMLNISVNTVESHITNALKTLRAKLSRFMSIVLMLF